MLNNKDTSIILQEPSKVNKPHILVKIGLNKDLNARAKKVYNLLVRKLLTLNLEEYSTNVINTNVRELSNLLKTTSVNDLYLSLNELLDCTMTFQEKYLKEEEEEVIIDNSTKRRNQSTTSVKLVSSITRNDIDDNIVIRFDTYLTSKILEYSDRYAKLDLEDLNALKNTYAITLYEIFIKALAQFEHKTIVMSEKDLRHFLNVKNKYENIKTFNQYVINKAIEEINKKTKISVTFKREKIDNKHIYKFEANQNYIVSFKKFKKALELYFVDREFIYKKNSYMIMKILEQEKYLLCSALTMKTSTTTKTKEIYEYLYSLYLSNVKFFIHCLLFKNLDIKIENFDSENFEDIEELLYFESFLKA